MPNENERKIIERLVHDSATELMPHELEKLLDSELQKPAEEMDIRLVRDLLEILQPDDGSQADKQATWRRIVQQLSKRTVKRKSRPLLKPIAAAAAVVVLLFGAMLGAASAFRWTFLLKILQPVAETFGIYMNIPDEATDAPENTDLYTITEDDTQQVTYTDLSLLPDTYNGYPIKPGWVPEGYDFFQATHFPGTDVQVFNIDYCRQTDWLSFTVTIIDDLDSVSNYVFERSLTEPIEKQVGSRAVTFYHNSENKRQSISWLETHAHYHINGVMTEADIIKMVESIASPILE